MHTLQGRSSFIIHFYFKDQQAHGVILLSHEVTLQSMASIIHLLTQQPS